MKKTCYFRGVIITTILLCSVSAHSQNTFYFPDKVMLTGFREIGEFKASISVKPQICYEFDWFIIPIASASATFSPAVDIAFAPADHLAIFTSYRGLMNKKPESKENYYYQDEIKESSYNGYTFEMGAGFFNKMTEKLILEVVAGYGNGAISSTGFFNDDVLPGIPPADYNYETKYHRAFLQSGASIRTERSLFTVGYRLTAQKFYDLQLSDPAMTYVYNGDKPLPNSYLANNLFYLLQPFLGMEVGHKYVKFNAQLGYSYQINERTLSGNTNSGLCISLGLGCNMQFFSRGARS